MLSNAVGCVAVSDCDKWREGAENVWDDSAQNFACLSVRTGFDLLLHSLALPKGSEVLVSAITILDMARIIEAHGLVPVAVDIEPFTLQPIQDMLEALVSPKSKMLLVAHLFGSRLDMEPLAEFAARYGLLLIEDCAQAFTGSRTDASPAALASMYSFGPIKTATALGGAILMVRDATLLSRMRGHHSSYPVQSSKSYFHRVFRFSLLKLISVRWIFGLLYWLMRLAGKDIDSLLNGTTRSFPSEHMLQQIRCQPCAALSRMLCRRLTNYSEEITVARARVGNALAAALHPVVAIPGVNGRNATWWVFPINMPQPMQLAGRLRDIGFDCTPGASAMRVVSAEDADCPNAERIVSDILYLPIQPDMSEKEIRRLAQGVLDWEAGLPNC